METMNLFINGISDFAIEETPNGTNYFVSDSYLTNNPFGVFISTTKEVFEENLRKVDWILTGWNKELRQDYLKMIEYVKTH